MEENYAIFLSDQENKNERKKDIAFFYYQSHQEFKIKNMKKFKIYLYLIF
jgi:hypothetical protein